MAAEAKAASPSRALVESARVLADPDMQAMLSTATKKLHESKLLNQVGDVLGLFKKHEEKNPAWKKKLTDRVAVVGVRKLGKLVVVVNFAVEQVARFKPTTFEELAKRARQISEKLCAQGFGGKDGIELPPCLVNCLQRMQAAATAQEGAAATAAVVQEQAAVVQEQAAATAQEGAVAAAAAVQDEGEAM